MADEGALQDGQSSADTGRNVGASSDSDPTTGSQLDTCVTGEKRALEIADDEDASNSEEPAAKKQVIDLSADDSGGELSPQGLLMMSRLNEVPEKCRPLVRALIGTLMRVEGEKSVLNLMATFIFGGDCKSFREAKDLLDWVELDLIHVSQLTVADIYRSIVQTCHDLAAYVEAAPVANESRSDRRCRAAQSKWRAALLEMFAQVHMDEAWHIDQIHPRNTIFYKQLNTFITPLDEASDEFRMLKMYFQGYVPEKKIKTKRKLWRVMRKAVQPKEERKVNRIFSLARIAEQKRYAAVPKSETCLYFHGTRLDRLASIFRQGLLLRNEYTAQYTGQSNNERGLWFSDTAKYSDGYCTSNSYRDLQDHLYMLVVELHLGDTDQPDTWLNAKHVLQGCRSAFSKQHDERLPDGTLLPQNADKVMVMAEEHRVVLRYLVEFNVGN